MTTVIYHRADFDGLFSAAVCMKFLPDAEFIGWDFGDPLIPFPTEGQVYIVDLSPDCIVDMSGEQIFERLVWIDHHKSSIEKWPTSIPGYRIDGVAACRLCWQWFKNRQLYEPTDLPGYHDYNLRQVKEPLALTLAGEYDVWDKRDERTEAFQFGLYARGEGMSWKPKFIRLPIDKMAGAPWNLLDHRGFRIAWCGTDGKHETDGELIANDLLNLVAIGEASGELLDTAAMKLAAKDAENAALQAKVAALEAAIVQYAIESGWHRMDGEAYPVIAELINRPKEKP